MKEKVEVAIRMLKTQGHTVEVQLDTDKGTRWYQVDERMRVSWQEMQDLADGVYNIEELEELYKRRQVEEQSA
jgi:hypothetical protein